MAERAILKEAIKLKEMNGPESEHFRPEESDQERVPERHPLKLEYRDGKIYTSEGIRFFPDFPVGSEQHQLDLLAEYIGTFGRGLAMSITHGHGDQTLNAERIYGKGVVSEYQRIANKLLPVLNHGTEEQTDAFIEELRQYRKKFPKLYNDVEANRPPKRNLTFNPGEIIKPHN
jgi:hypothetical protein